MESNSQDLESIVLNWLAEHNRNADFASAKIEPTTNLLEEGILDSLAFIDLLAFLEQQTGQSVDLSELEPEEFSTVQGLCTHMQHQPSS